MLGSFSPDDLRNLSGTLRRIGGSLDWSTKKFTHEKNAYMVRLAQLAYSAVGPDERRYRAKLMPSQTFRSLARGGAFDFVAVLRSGDFERVIVVRSGFFVAVIIVIAQDIFIGVRGTVFAYDWGINFSARRRSGDPTVIDPRSPPSVRLRDYEGFLHSGFYRETLILSHLIEQEIRRDLSGGAAARVHIAGHSLGGAVAALIAMRGLRPHDEHFSRRNVYDCYIYGSPRIGSARAVRDAVVYATRRHDDLVPHTPPLWLGYADFLLEFGSDGLPYVRKQTLRAHMSRWVRHVRFRPVIEDHMLEAYIGEIDAAAQPSRAAFAGADFV
jgi:pimeloyl-ACP methyl ester carboxylesterase